MNLHHSRTASNSDKLTLPPISIMNEYLPTRSWVPPSTLSPNSSTKSLPTPPQYDHQWKSPPYKSNNELSRDSSYTYYNKTSPLLFSTTSPIMQQQQTPSIDYPQSPKHQPQMKSSYFQYTSKAYHSNINNNNIATSPSSSSYTSTTTNNSNRVDSEIEEVVRQCDTLRDTMLQRKSQFIQSHSTSEGDHQSTRPILDDMIGRANEVLNALLRLRKHQLASEQNSAQNQTNYVSSDHTSTWRMGQPSSPSSSTMSYTNSNNSNSNGSIRPRKRGKRPAFQGRCHSCNISSTPEWRRGPDGARTLCNACGLHYAKLARKQQENRGMSTTASRRISSVSSNSSKNISLLTTPPSPPPARDIILDRSPSG